MWSRVQPKLTMEAEGDFPLWFTAPNRGLRSEAERAQVAIKQHPTRRGAQTRRSWCSHRACVSPQHTVTHSSLVLEIAAQTVCFCIHWVASHRWLPLSITLCFLDLGNLKDGCLKSWWQTKDRRLKFYSEHRWGHLFFASVSVLVCRAHSVSLLRACVWAGTWAPRLCVNDSPQTPLTAQYPEYATMQETKYG